MKFTRDPHIHHWRELSHKDAQGDVLQVTVTPEEDAAGHRVLFRVNPNKDSSGIASMNTKQARQFATKLLKELDRK